jgi:hypothetical protein
MLNASTTASWKTYACRYYHDGKWWALDLVAKNDEDAEARARKLGNLQLLGEVKVRIPAVAGAGFVVRAVTSLRNFLSRRAHSVD